VSRFKELFLADSFSKHGTYVHTWICEGGDNRRLEKTVLKCDVICAPHQMLFRWSYQGWWNGSGV